MHNKKIFITEVYTDQQVLLKKNLESLLKIIMRQSFLKWKISKKKIIMHLRCIFFLKYQLLLRRWLLSVAVNVILDMLAAAVAVYIAALFKNCG